MTDPSLGHLVDRAAAVEERVRQLVAARHAHDPHPDDAFRGLYVSDELVDRLVAGPAADAVVQRSGVAEVERRAELLETDGATLRLRSLARAAGLTDLDVELLLVALLPDLESRFERIYGYLNDDVTRRRASVGLALLLAGGSTLGATSRARLGPGGPLLVHRLLELEDPERPFLTRGLRVPDRVVQHLLGDDAVEDVLLAHLRDVDAHPSPYAAALGRAIGGGVRLVHLRDVPSGAATGLARAALAEVGLGAVLITLDPFAEAPDVLRVVAAGAREALLRGAGLVLDPLEALGSRTPVVLRALRTAAAPVLLVGTSSWDPSWTEDSPLLVEAPELAVTDRHHLWRQAASAAGTDLDVVDLVGHLALGPVQIRRALEAAQASAALDGGTVRATDLRIGVRAQNAAGLERLARRIEPEVGWDDLVLTPAVHGALLDLASRARNRRLVLGDWRMRRGGGRGQGVTALFGGDSGTGKTMSAEVVAADLGLDLYTVNLATVVDKYVGETEKNLERIFTEASGVNAVLFFDEADAIFGKRSDVRDAHDRYANIESAYLLQRLETFDGLAVLATNLRSNVDDAFTRRLDAIIDFPAPTTELRRALWERCLAAPLPVADDLDLDLLAARFELAGGNIRSAATSAAYLAAGEGSSVTMGHVVRAVEQEYRKLGRLLLEREFGGRFEDLTGKQAYA